MVAVVTGAAGFIGRVLLETLVARGGEVVAIDRRPLDHPTGTGTTPASGRVPSSVWGSASGPVYGPVSGEVRVVQADLLDHDPAVTAALQHADVVYHLAGCPQVRDPRPDAQQHRYRDNVLATAAVLAKVPLEVPLVVTSSSSVYGGTKAGRPSVETDRLRPRGGYARSKLLVERLCEARLQAGGLVAVVRPFTVAGEGQRPGMALARWISAARAGQPLPLLGDPERSRDITDVRDAARALVDLAGRRALGVVNVGTGVGRTLRELAAAVCTAVGVQLRTVLNPAHPAEVRHTLADTRRLRELIGWVPRTDLDALIARQLARLDERAAAAVMSRNA